MDRGVIGPSYGVDFLKKSMGGGGHKEVVESRVKLMGRGIERVLLVCGMFNYPDI